MTPFSYLFFVFLLMCVSDYSELLLQYKNHKGDYLSETLQKPCAQGQTLLIKMKQVLDVSIRTNNSCRSPFSFGHLIVICLSPLYTAFKFKDNTFQKVSKHLWNGRQCCFLPCSFNAPLIYCLVCTCPWLLLFSPFLFLAPLWLVLCRVLD